MCKIKFKDMNNMKKRKLYECMWGGEEFQFPAYKTEYRGAYSNNSYTFFDKKSIADENICSELAALFGIQDWELFKKKFDRSISGSGRELKNIARLHSSSLCALLFFYNLSVDNTFQISIGEKEYSFYNSDFEYQNPVIKNRHPSNIDIVLTGEEIGSGKEAVLFLESKFSEYYEGTGRQLKINSAYLNDPKGKAIYNEASLKKIGLEMVPPDGNENFLLRSKETCYLAGIKQMISHYIGVRNLCENPDEGKGEIANKVKKGAKVLLGEILFEDRIGQLPIGKGIGCFKSYKDKYHKLAAVLNEQLQKDRISEKITVLPDVLYYSIFQDNSFVLERIREFYFASGKKENHEGIPAKKC